MKKSTLIAVAVFAALLVATVFTMSRKPERGITRISFEQVSAEAIDRVELTGKHAVTLQKDGEAWRLDNGKQAESAAVKRLLEAIPKLISSDLVTSSADRYAELEVDEEKGTRIKASAAGQVMADFVVGKAAKGGAYVRVRDAVYAVPRVYPGTFARERSAWLERKLFADALASISRVEVALGGQPPYALVKSDNTWKLEDPSVVPAGFRLDANGLSGLVSALVNVRAKEILDADPGLDTTKLGPEADVLAFVVEQGEGEAKTGVRRELRLGGALDDKSVYAQVTGKADVVTLAEPTLKSLRKEPKDFRDLKVMELDQSKVQSLTIVDGATRLVLEKQGAEWRVASSSDTPPPDFALDPAAVARRLGALANARAAKVADGVGVAAAGLSAPAAKVIAKLEDGRSVALRFGKPTKDEDRDMVYVAGNADGLVYLATKWTRDNLTGGLQSFKKTEAPSDPLSNLDPKALSGLPPDVRAQLMQQMEQKKRQQEMMERLQKQVKAE